MSSERKLDRPIRISLETKSRLVGYAIYGDDYDSIINRIADLADKELARQKKEVKAH